MAISAAFRNRGWLILPLLLSFTASAHAASMRGGLHSILDTAANHKLAVLLVMSLLALAVAVWLARRRQFRLLAVLAGAAVVVAAAFGVHRFREHYPNADLFGSARLRDSAAILLGTDIRLSKFEPRSMLVLPNKSVTRAMYPAIDVHFHLESLSPTITPEHLVQAMDATGVAKLINMGGTRERFEEMARKFHAPYPDRFVMFLKPDFSAVARKGGIADQVKWIDEAARLGALGIGEINKSLGLGIRDADGRLIQVDDPRLNPIWDEAGRLGMPVLIHTGDPPAFFLPIDAKNERYEELSSFPEWGRSEPGTPTFKELMAARERLVAQHPGTNFIGAHIGSNEDDLAYASYLLDRYPNYYLDMSARAAALGREPYSARRFLIKYQDRILFGTDGGYGLEAEGPGWTPERYFRSYFEFLETDNEYMEYPQWPLSQGRWRIYGLYLPPEVLEKIYARNIERLLPTQAQIAARLAERTLPVAERQN